MLFRSDAIKSEKDEANKNAFHEGKCIQNLHQVDKKCCGSWPNVDMYNPNIYCCDGNAELHFWHDLTGQGGLCEAEWVETDLHHLMIDLPYYPNNTHF